MNEYKKEWIALLLKQNYPGWLIADDRNHIFINVPNDQDLDVVIDEFRKKIELLKKMIKSKPTKIGFFIGNNKDSKFYELNS